MIFLVSMMIIVWRLVSLVVLLLVLLPILLALYQLF